MTTQETAKILALVSVAYPSFINNRDVDATIGLWSMIFEDESYAEVEAAFKAYVSTDVKGFPPAPGALKEKIATLFRKKDGMSEVEAWALVSRAIRRGIYNSAEEFSKLPKVIQNVVGSPEMIKEWAMMPVDEVETVVASNFQRSYKMRSGWYEDVEKLPSGLRDMIPALGEAVGFPGDAKPALPDYTGTGSMIENLRGSTIPDDVKQRITDALGIKEEVETI